MDFWPDFKYLKPPYVDGSKPELRDLPPIRAGLMTGGSGYDDSTAAVEYALKAKFETWPDLCPKCGAYWACDCPPETLADVDRLLDLVMGPPAPLTRQLLDLFIEDSPPS